jgi:hypothetical protein
MRLPPPPQTPPARSWKWSKPYAVQMARSLEFIHPDGTKTNVSGPLRDLHPDCAPGVPPNCHARPLHEAA